MPLPPTSSKISTDANNVTTFNYQFPNFTGTHTGVTLALGINSVAGGGTGLSAITANNLLIGNGTSALTLLPPNTAGYVLTDQGAGHNPVWAPQTTGGAGFFAASNIVNTNDVGNSATNFNTPATSPAFTFTPTVSGTYKIYASVPLYTATTNTNAAVRIFNTSGGATLLEESQGVIGAAPSPDVGVSSAYCQSVYTLTASTSYVFDYQTKIISASGTVQSVGGLTQFYLFAEGVATGTAANLVIGTIDGNGASANGLSILASTLYAQSASSSNPGMVNNTSQTFSGSKNFTSPIGYNNTTPAANTSLDIINTTGATQRIVQTGYGGTVGLRGRYANGTLGSPTAAVSGNILNFFSGLGYGASQFAASSTGALNVVAGETFTNTSNATYLQFNVTPTGSVTTAEQMRLNSTGNLLIGTTTDSGTQKLQVNGNSNVGTVTAGVWNGTVTAGQSVLTVGTTYTTPAGITTATRFKFTLIGGGGGGGGINTAADTASGGGGGAAVVIYAAGLSPSTAYTISIGSAGAGGISVTTPSTAGGSTTLTMSSVTYTAGGGNGGADTALTNGGAGGTATNTFATGFATGGFNVPGQQGNGATSVASANGGAGGSSGLAMGMGGASVSAAGTGIAGTGFGSGGSGGKGATATGGAGSGGAIIVEWNN
jgi:hypothetical protein